MPHVATFRQEVPYYLKTAVIGLLVFAVSYSYIKWMKIPGELNKSVADTAIILMGMSMLLTSLCYYLPFMKSAILYRKYLGLIGFAFGIAHVVLSQTALKSLFLTSTWEQGKQWPAFTGLLAIGIFALMASISHSFWVVKIGLVKWKNLLRTGYLATLLVWLHVVLLKSGRWITWFEEGMKTPPSLSLVVAVFMILVILSRLVLQVSLLRNKPQK